MKKVNLKDCYGLTRKFLGGELRLLVDGAWDSAGRESVEPEEGGRYWRFSDGLRVHSRFGVGEAVPVLMSYENCGFDRGVWGHTAGWSDKRRVRADLMPVRMLIDSVEVVRCGSLGWRDWLSGGVVRSGDGYGVGGRIGGRWDEAEEAWADLIGKWWGVPVSLDPWLLIYRITPAVPSGIRSENYKGGR